MSAVNQILARVGRLPPMPDTVIKLLGVLNDPDSTVEQIVEVIRYDQAVTAEVLRLCNSAYVALPRTVHSLGEAMHYLGTTRVLGLVMTLHNGALLSRAQRGYGLEAGDLWRHSVAVALAASSFAQRIELGNQNLCFTAGLLHDIGKVVLNECVAGGLAAIREQVTLHQLSFAEAETQVLGCSHEEIGAALGEQWRLPEPILRCIRYHHAPGALTPPDPLVDVVYLADCVCLLLGVGLGTDELYYRADAATMERHRLHESDLEVIGAQALADLCGIEEMFHGASRGGRSATAGDEIGALRWHETS